MPWWLPGAGEGSSITLGWPPLDATSVPMTALPSAHCQEAASCTMAAQPSALQCGTKWSRQRPSHRRAAPVPQPPVNSAIAPATGAQRGSKVAPPAFPAAALEGAGATRSSHGARQSVSQSVGWSWQLAVRHRYGSHGARQSVSQSVGWSWQLAVRHRCSSHAASQSVSSGAQLAGAARQVHRLKDQPATSRKATASGNACSKGRVLRMIKACLSHD